MHGLHNDRWRGRIRLLLALGEKCAIITLHCAAGGKKSAAFRNRRARLWIAGHTTTWFGPAGLFAGRHYVGRIAGLLLAFFAVCGRLMQLRILIALLTAPGISTDGAVAVLPCFF